ncbi:hypothetical protein C4553_00225 [Candidatus Parcubacteria bacterium]|nr:MAG: hypothetical protein C4553_00225 [Candidatus Parcubacteria bacterium]
MTKDDEINSGVEFFYKLSLKPEFQNDLAEARKHLGITPSGYMDPQTREKLWIEYKKANVIELLGTELHLKTKYKVPTPYFEFIDDYIFFGKPVNAPKKKSPVALLSPTKELEDLYDGMYEPTAKLLLFGNATQEKVLEFIKKNWREIELTLNKNINKTHRVRKTTHKEQNRTIRELWRTNLGVLQKEAGSTTKERDLLVSRILVKRGLTTKELSGGYIRKVANQKE